MTVQGYAHLIHAGVLLVSVWTPIRPLTDARYLRSIKTLARLAQTCTAVSWGLLWIIITFT